MRAMVSLLSTSRRLLLRTMLPGRMLDLPTPLPLPINEPILSYAPGSPERATLKAALATMSKEQVDVPHVVAGKESRDGAVYEVRAPHDHKLLLATCHD